MSAPHPHSASVLPASTQHPLHRRHWNTALALALFTSASALPFGLHADSGTARAPGMDNIGYLQGDTAPDSLAISPPPPEPGSLWAQLDAAVAREALNLRGSARWAQARVDALADFPEGARLFACALGVPVDEEHTPTLYRLLNRIQYDAGYSASKSAKEHYQRTRPFMAEDQPICTPEHEAAIRANGSYPSGHTAVGWTWALTLAEIAPERATPIFRRGRNYGHSRLVCNVHWYSDVVEGQAIGAATVALLHANAEYVQDLAQARRELEHARTLNLPLPHDCEAEAEALAADLPEAR